VVDTLPANEQSFCGRSGWYTHDGANIRDTDWLIMQMGYLGFIEIIIDAEFPVHLFELFPQDCETVDVAQQMTAGPCDPVSMTIMGYSEGGPVWVWVGPTTFQAPGDVTEFDYSLFIIGLMHVEAAEPTSWSHVKALYGD